MNNLYLLDSWAMLALLYRENPATDRVVQLLHQAADGQAHSLLSLINLVIQRPLLGCLCR